MAIDLRSWRSKSSFVLALGCGILVILIAVLGIGAIKRSQTIYKEMQSTQDAYLRSETFRREIATDIHLSSILVRDYLLDPSRENAPKHREQLRAIQKSIQDRLDVLSSDLRDPDHRVLDRLNDELQGYWDSLDPMFEWTPQEKAERSYSFLRQKVLPRREAAVDLAREVARVNQANIERERARIQESQHVYEGFLKKVTGSTLLIGIFVAVITTARVSSLERVHEEQKKQLAESQIGLRRLSRSLVQAQETERKSLSRELHDEVGQTLTALGIELANLEALRSNEKMFHKQIEDLKVLSANAVRSLRDLAMGLRPSMLDDLGLEAALEWQGREFSRHTGVPATVQVSGAFNTLNESQRTCIYRVVQEALTNCARHASAKSVLVSVTETNHGVAAVVHDDGTGFDLHSAKGGLGLLNIQERVQALDGRLQIVSEKAKGTTVRVEIPLESAIA